MARGEKIWVVRAGDGASVGEIVRSAGVADAAIAIEEGRVFIGKKRALRADQAVRVGDAVRIAAPPHSDRGLLGRSTSSGAGEGEPIQILLHGHGLLAINKPAGLPTVPDHEGASHALVARAARAVGLKSEDLRVTSRLDREVSGVVVFALDAEAEDRLRKARAEGTYHRRYVALACSHAHAHAHEVGLWDAPIGRAPNPHLRAARGPDAKDAVTHWRRIASVSLTDKTDAIPITLLAVDPMTGRTHQIRVHASDAGLPLIGDRDYGGKSRLVLPNGRILAPSRIALHAARVVVPNAKGDPLEVTAPVPTELTSMWAALGGEPEAWNRAVSCKIVLP